MYCNGHKYNFPDSRFHVQAVETCVVSIVSTMKYDWVIETGGHQDISSHKYFGKISDTIGIM